MQKSDPRCLGKYIKYGWENYIRKYGWESSGWHTVYEATMATVQCKHA